MMKLSSAMKPISNLAFLAVPLAAYAKFAPPLQKDFESMILPNTAHLYKAPCLPESMAGEETLAAVPIMTSDYFDEFEIGGQKQTSVPFVRTPDARFADLAKNGFPYQPNYIEVEGLRMHYIDETGPVGSPTTDAPQATYLLLHGQPTWSYLYRKIIATLLKYPVRVIAVDLIGMGRSDKPIDLSFHKYETHVRLVKKFIQSNQHFDKSPGISGSKTGYPLKHLTTFGQDWGASIIMNAIADIMNTSGNNNNDDESTFESTFDRSIVGNGLFFHSGLQYPPFPIFEPADHEPKPFDCADERTLSEALHEGDKVLMATVATKGVGPALTVWSNYCMTNPFFKSSEFMISSTNCNCKENESNLDLGSAVPTPLDGSPPPIITEEQALMYDAPFPTIYHKAGPRMFPSMFASLLADENALKATDEAWQKLLKFNKPWLHLAGDLDQNYGHQYVQMGHVGAIPGAKVHDVEHKRFMRSGHFLQEDEGEDIAEYIWEFVQRTPMQSIRRAEERSTDVNVIEK